ncbi:MAG: PilZ domain-containing protein [Desulfobacterales bacterium]|nr:PilZ domain-containing protein [Desulfobacterales bacterium]
MIERLSSKSAGRLSDADFSSFEGGNVSGGEWNEKRSSPRYPLEEPVILKTDEGEMIGAVVINYGHRGLYFESYTEMKRGSVIEIRNESSLSMPCQAGCRAQVRWTRRVGQKSSDYRYGTGVQYC